MENEVKKRIIKKYIFISFLLIAISVSILLMIKYNVEGEKNLPLELDKVIIKSSINAKSNQSENLWDLNLEQDNDIYIYFKKSFKKAVFLLQSVSVCVSLWHSVSVCGTLCQSVSG